jgi:hypothetical protein
MIILFEEMGWPNVVGLGLFFTAMLVAFWIYAKYLDKK